MEVPQGEEIIEFLVIIILTRKKEREIFLDSFVSFVLLAVDF